jgi:hypothetical protein
MKQMKQIILGEKNNYGEVIKIVKDNVKSNLNLKCSGLLKSVINYNEKYKIDILLTDKESINEFNEIDKEIKLKSKVGDVKWYGIVRKNNFGEDILRLKVTKYSKIFNSKKNTINIEKLSSLLNENIGATIHVNILFTVLSLYSTDDKENNDKFAGVNLFLNILNTEKMISKKYEECI